MRLSRQLRALINTPAKGKRNAPHIDIVSESKTMSVA
jgi:hypothetical protein